MRGQNVFASNELFYYSVDQFQGFKSKGKGGLRVKEGFGSGHHHLFLLFYLPFLKVTVKLTR